MKKLSLVVAMTFAVICADAQPNYHFDVNNDGEVNVTDVMLVVESVLGKQPSYRPITVRVSERPLTHPTSAKVGARRAPTITTSSLETFYLNMMYQFRNRWRSSDRSETKKTADGTFENNGSWPSNAPDESTVHVFAYKTSYKANEQPFVLDGGNPYLQISTEESSSDQCDVLVAKTDAIYDECHGVIDLTFDHICAALQFSVIKSSSLENQQVEVNEIVLHQVKKNGKYMLMDGTWSDVGTYRDFTLQAYQAGTANAITVSSTEETLLAKNADDLLFLIPQPLNPMTKGTPIADADAENKSYIEIRCKIYDSSQYYVGSATNYGSVYLPFGVNLSAGHVHPFVINIGTAIRDANGNKVI